MFLVRSFLSVATAIVRCFEILKNSSFVTESLEYYNSVKNSYVTWNPFE